MSTVTCPKSPSGLHIFHGKPACMFCGKTATSSPLSRACAACNARANENCFPGCIGEAANRDKRR